MKAHILARWLSVVLLVSLTIVSTAQDRTLEGAQDHPLVSRFPGSVIVRHQSVEFDELLIPLAEATAIGEFADTKRVNGKVTRLTYEMPKGHSTLEVVQSYSQALASAGFKILFSCAMEECGPHLYFQKLERPFIIDKDHRYFAAAKDLPQGRVYVSARVYTTARGDPPVRAMIEIAEERGMEEGLIKIDAQAMAHELEKSGHVAIYGVYFDTNESEIRQGSEASLNEMAKLLKMRPELKVYIVGHTDSVGTLAHNMELSQRRAEAVVDVLLSTYGVEAARLMASGVGPYAPIASNQTEFGRARNRRVELVEQ